MISAFHAILYIGIFCAMFSYITTDCSFNEGINLIVFSFCILCFHREDYYQEGNHVHPRLKVLEAYKRALLSWARWVDKNIDSNRTLVFFRGYSVTHFRCAIDFLTPLCFWLWLNSFFVIFFLLLLLIQFHIHVLVLFCFGKKIIFGFNLFNS